MDAIFQRLNSLMAVNEALLNSIATKLQQIESVGGGSASIEDYAVDKNYVRNALVVDTNTETVYRVLTPYTSTTLAYDIEHGFLKLVGFESQVVMMDHNPTQNEIDTLPDDSLVAVYSATDAPFVPDL